MVETIMKKELSLEEIRTIAQEYDRLADWKAVKDFAEKWYGASVTKVRIEVGSEYNDEGGYNPRIEDMLFYDAEGNRIEQPDLSLPAWDEHRDEIACIHEWNREDYITDILREERYELPHSIDDAYSTVTYDLTQQPTITYPIVYAEVTGPAAVTGE